MYPTWQFEGLNLNSKICSKCFWFFLIQKSPIQPTILAYDRQTFQSLGTMTANGCIATATRKSATVMRKLLLLFCCCCFVVVVLLLLFCCCCYFNYFMLKCFDTKNSSTVMQKLLFLYVVGVIIICSKFDCSKPVF